MTLLILLALVSAFLLWQFQPFWSTTIAGALLSFASMLLSLVIALYGSQIRTLSIGLDAIVGRRLPAAGRFVQGLMSPWPELSLFTAFLLISIGIGFDAVQSFVFDLEQTRQIAFPAGPAARARFLIWLGGGLALLTSFPNLFWFGYRATEPTRPTSIGRTALAVPIGMVMAHVSLAAYHGSPFGGATVDDLARFVSLNLAIAFVFVGLVQLGSKARWLTRPGHTDSG